MSTLPRRRHANSGVTLVFSQHDDKVAPVPVCQPAKGIHNNNNNMVVTHPREHRVVYSPAQSQQGNTQSQENIQFPSAYVSAQHGSYRNTPVKNTVRQSVLRDGQVTEYIEQKGSDLNITSGSQKRLPSNFASSAHFTSSALQKNSSPVQKLHSVTHCKDKYFSNVPSLSADPNTKSELYTRSSFLGGGQQVPQKDDPIHNFILKMVSSHRSKSLTGVIEQPTTATGQALEENSSKYCKEKDYTRSSSKTYSTEYTQMMGKVAATGEEGPVVLMVESKKALNKVTVEHPSSSLNCSSSQEHNSLGLASNDVTESTSSNDIRVQNKGECNQANCEYTKAMPSLPSPQRPLFVKGVKEWAPSESESKKPPTVETLKDPQFEDISDEEDMSQLVKEDLQYENVSEDENSHIPNMAVKRPTLDTEPCCSGLSLVETDDSPQLVLETKHSFSCSPSFAIADERDDDWLVVPISVSDLRFEPEHEDPQELVEDDKEIQCRINPTHYEHHRPAPRPSQLEVFDTPESFLKIFKERNMVTAQVVSGWHTPELELDSEREPHTSQDRRESYSGGSDTDDSSDNPPGLKHNYMTVSTNAQKDLGNLRLVIETKTSTKCGQHMTDEQETLKNDIITIDSDTEDESDLNCKKETQNKRFSSPCSNGSEEAPWSPQKRYASSPENQSMLDNQLKDVVQTLTEDNIIIIDSETEDGPDQNNGKKYRERPLSSGSVGVGDAPNVQQKIHLPGTVSNEYEIPPDSLLPQHQSKVHDTHVEEAIQDVSFASSHTKERSGQLMKAETCSELDQCNITRPQRSKGRINTERKLSFGSEGSGLDQFAKKCSSTESVDHRHGTANKKLDPKLSLEDPKSKQPKSTENSSQSTHNTRLIKESQILVKRTDKPQAPKTFKGISENEQYRKSFKHKGGDNGHHSTKNNVWACIAKPKVVASQLSIPSEEGPSSNVNLTLKNGQLYKAKQSSVTSTSVYQSREASCSLPEPKQRSYAHSPQRSGPYSSNPTLDPPFALTKASHPATMHQVSLAKTHMTEEWKKGFIPTRRDRKRNMRMDRDLKNTNHDSCKEPRPGPSPFKTAPKRRCKAQRCEPPLMKKTKFDAIQRTKDIHQNTTRKQRSFVGDGYKWSDKPKVFKSN